jgi:hypothetical protein
LTVAAVSIAPAVAQSPAPAPAQPAPASNNSGKPLRAELALSYSYLRSNEPPGGCGCFNLNGGSATFAWPVRPGSFALVGDVTVAHAGSAAGTACTLTLSAFTAGARYLPKLARSLVQPYGQTLVGLVHSTGTLVLGSKSSGPECRRGLCRQPRRRPRPTRQQTLFGAPYRGRLPRDQRRQFFEGKRDHLYQVEIFYAIVLEGPRSKSGIGAAFAQLFRDPAGAVGELRTQFTNNSMKVLLRSQVENELAKLDQKVQTFARQLADFMQIEVLNQQGQFRFFRRLLNYDEGRIAGRPQSTQFLDYQVVNSNIEAERNHLRVSKSR